MPSSDYMRGWRQTDAGKAATRKQKRREKARYRALTDLAKLFPGEFQALLTMHLGQLEREEQDQ